MYIITQTHTHTYKDQKHQENVLAAANMICQMKQRYMLNKRHDKMDEPAVEEFPHVSIYPILEYMGVDTDISDGVSKMRASTILGDIVRLHQHTKNMLRYVHKTLKVWASCCNTIF